MTGPRKVRIFRDVRKSPNWYVEWRDQQGRRHCESCGPKREDAKERAGQIAEELQRQRMEAKLQEVSSQKAAGDDIAGSTGAGGCDGSSIVLRGVLRCGQEEVPISLCFELPSMLVGVLRQLLYQAGH